MKTISKHAYSREELAGKMTKWMIAMWGHPMELTEESRDRWMERNGMLYAFICDHFPETRRNSESRRKNCIPNAKPTHR
jgi:hypothetical protein